MCSVITTEPLSKSTYNRETTHSETEIPENNEVNTNEAILDNHDLNEEVLDSDRNNENDEEEKRRKKRREAQDCCFYIDDDDGLCLNIFCRCFSECLQCIGRCTEACCNGCEQCLNNCCDGNPNTHQEFEANHNDNRGSMGFHDSGAADIGGCCGDNGGDDTGCYGDGGGDDTGCYGDGGGDDTGYCGDGGDTGCCDD